MLGYLPFVKCSGSAFLVREARGRDGKAARYVTVQLRFHMRRNLRFSFFLARLLSSALSTEQSARDAALSQEYELCHQAEGSACSSNGCEIACEETLADSIHGQKKQHQCKGLASPARAVSQSNEVQCNVPTECLHRRQYGRTIVMHESNECVNGRMPEITFLEYFDDIDAGTAQLSNGKVLGASVAHPAASCGMSSISAYR